MEINNINSNINNVNQSQNSSLERISTGLKINQAADDAASLSISDSLRLQRSDLSQSLQNLNQGIALTRIASDGLDNQQEILGDIRQKLLQANTDTTSVDGKEAIKQEVLKLTEQFQNIAQTTTFADQKLITPEATSTTLDISTADETFSLDIPNTGQIANELTTLIGATDFGTGDIAAIIDRIDVASNQVSSAQSDFGSTENQLASSARNSITAEVNIAKANSSLTDIDFGKELTDFSKANILTQIGYLVSTQANAVQEQNVKLLA
ncbi:hypothetical protein A9Q76_04760 [Arcobacter sp. 31_11_sub10_T18]|nr:hypothetical protein A9Q76_04760 [Arcobacter sp. 31_11_sub10_T18]